MASVESQKKAFRQPKTARASVSFPQELYESLEQIAQEKKVSVAWVVRDAIEKYVADKWPLFEREARR